MAGSLTARIILMEVGAGRLASQPVGAPCGYFLAADSISHAGRCDHVRTMEQSCISALACWSCFLAIWVQSVEGRMVGQALSVPGMLTSLAAPAATPSPNRTSSYGLDDSVRSLPPVGQKRPQESRE
jgi:hypothetical protein